MLAIIITIMVLEMKVPAGADLSAAIYVLVALIWLVPDCCIERALRETEG